MGKNGQKRPKKTKKDQNEKNPARPVAVPLHWKSVGKSGLELPPVAKTAIFGQKVPKKCRFAVRMAPSGKVLRI